MIFLIEKKVVNSRFYVWSGSETNWNGSATLLETLLSLSIPSWLRKNSLVKNISYLYHISGVYKVLCNLIFFPIIVFLNLIFFPKISVPFPSSPLDNLPYSLNIKEQIDITIILPLTLFSTWYSSQKPLNYLPLFTTWNSSRLINFPPPQDRLGLSLARGLVVRGGEWWTLYTPAWYLLMIFMSWLFPGWRGGRSCPRAAGTGTISYKLDFMVIIYLLTLKKFEVGYY